MLTISLKELEALQPCDMDRRRPWFGATGRKRLSAAQALKAGATVRDVLWVAGKLGRKDLCVRFALLCAQRVAHLNPDPRVQRALDAAQAWLDNPCEETRKAAYAAAAHVAAAAVYAVHAVHAAHAAHAAAAAAAAVHAAAYAAYADAAYAAYADAADAAVARQKEQEAQRKILIKVFSA